MNSDTLQSSASTPPSRGALRPKARLLRTLGSDLISSDKVALIELVKNSYDADASVVVIRFCGRLDEGVGRIEVWDDGYGMNVEILRNSWLDIGTDAKKRRAHSASGRRVLGEKGIGRLAASRLGSELLLATRMIKDDEVKLLIDWTDFDREDAYLDQIEVAWEVGAPDVFSDAGAAVEVFTAAHAEAWQSGHGTLIQIDRLSRTWVREDILELRTALTRLIRPRPTASEGFADAGSSIPDFSVILELVGVDEGIEDLAGPIGPLPELQTPHYSLTGSVDAQGSATLSYIQEYPPLKKEIGVKQLWTDADRTPQAGPFDFEVKVWDRDNDALKRTLQERGGASGALSTKALKGFRDTLSEVAGVSIYRDGFRVLPFGEGGDDWLGLDLRRVQTPTRRVSNNQIIGNVFIGADANAGLKDQSNREGFLAGAAYSDLQTLVKAALSELEAQRYVARHPKKTPSDSKGGLFERFDLRDIRAAIAQGYPGDRRIIELVDNKNRAIQEGVAEVQNVLSRYSRLATLGKIGRAHV